MANATTTRLSPAELRRKLMAPPTDPGAAAAVAAEEASRPVTRKAGVTMMMDFGDNESVDLNTITIEQLGAARLGVGKATPLPTQRLDLASYSQAESATLSDMNLPEAMLVSSSNDEVVHLQTKNAELRRLIEEMKPVIQEAATLEERLQQRELEFKAEIEQRDRQISELQEHLRLIEEQVTNAAPPIPKTPDELDEWADELEKESARLSQQRRQLELERKQLHEDEGSLEAQMRQMEVQMARERATMARQETELKRLSSDIQHELEIMQRGDGALREQLSKFQRRHQDVLRTR